MLVILFFIACLLCEDNSESISNSVEGGKLVMISDDSIESKQLAKYMIEKGTGFNEYNTTTNPDVLRYTKEKFGDLELPTLIKNDKVEMGMPNSVIFLKSLNSAYST